MAANRRIFLAPPAVLVLVLATVLVTLTPSAAPASASRGAGKVAGRSAVILHTFARLGSCRARGAYAYCSASGSVNHPVSIHLHVTARRAQRVSGYWSTYCSNGSRSRREFSSYAGWASPTHPLRRTLGMSYRHPSSCQATADGQLAHGGRMHVWLTTWH